MLLFYLYINMSQVIKKLQEGGNFFSYPEGKIETNRLIQAISANMDDYVNSQNWTKKRKERFINSVGKFVSGIENGNITSMSPIGTFTDSRGISGGGVSDETGTRRFKDDKEAATFVKWVLQAQTPYQEVKKKEETVPFNLNTAFAKTFNKNVLHTESDALDPTQLQNVAPAIKNNIVETLFNQLSQVDSPTWGAYETKDNYLKEVEAARKRLMDIKASKAGKYKDNMQGYIPLSNARAELAKLGLDPSFLDYFTPKSVNKTDTSTTPQQNTTTTTNTGNTTNTENTGSTTSSNSGNNVSKFLWNSSIQNWWAQNKNNSIQVLPSRMSPSYYEASLVSTGSKPDYYINNLLTKLGTINYSQYSSNAPSQYVLPIFNGGKWITYPTSYNQALGNTLDYLVRKKDSKYLIKLDDGKGYAIAPTLSVKNNGTGLVSVYNPSSRQLIQVPAYFLLNDSKVGPLIQSKLHSISSTGPAMSYSIPWRKEGGEIQKMQTGSKFNSSLISWDSERFKNLYDQGNLSLQSRKNNATDLQAPNNDYYDIEQGGKEVENQKWWNWWTTQLSTNPTLAEQWAKDYVNLQTPYKKTYQDKWFPNNKFDFNAFKQSSNLWSDKINGIGHDVYKGKVYRIKGTDTYDTLENLEAKGYKLTNDKPVTLDDNPLVDVYEVTKDINIKPNLGTEKINNSTVTAIPKKYSDEFNNQIQKWLLPLSGSFARFVNTEVGNKQLLNELLKLRPYYKDPKRFERNIYGNYGALSSHLNNAAKIITSATSPMYADPSLEAARANEGERLASEERTKGNLAYSQGIKDTMEKTIAQDLQNMAWEVDNTNENRYNQWNNETIKNQGRQGYISRKHQNINTLLQELQNLEQQRQNLRSQVDQNALNVYAQDKFRNNPELKAMQQEITAWVNSGKNMTDYPKYKEYLKLIDKITKEQLDFNIKTLGNFYGVGYNKGILSSLRSAKAIPQTFKSGGSAHKLKIAKIKNKLEEQKLFQKNISESIKDNTRMLQSLSNTMQKLLMAVIK